MRPPFIRSGTKVLRRTLTFNVSESGCAGDEVEVKTSLPIDRAMILREIAS